MQFFGQNCPDKPTQLSEDDAKLRAALILEEAFETITKGLGLSIELYSGAGDVTTISEENLTNISVSFIKDKEVDLVELADGLADLAYVAEFGTAVAAGIDLEPIQEEVHRSNMTKAWTEDDIKKAQETHPEAKVEKYSENLYRLIRPDGKVIKSPSYGPADIASIIANQSAK